MSTTGELIRNMIQSFMKNDSASFRANAQEFIQEERRKNHHILARDIERLLANGVSQADTTKTFSLLGLQSTDLPRDKERGVLLVEMKEPKRLMNSMVLSKEVEQSLNIIIQENRQAELLRSFGLRPASKILFCGPPGCGKTVAAEIIAQALYLPLTLVRFDAVVSSYLGETSANLRKVFDFARTRSMVVLFDEFDAIGKHRTAVEEHGELKRVVNSFLQMLDGFSSDTMLIAATNHQGLLDSALWRRFDNIVFFDRPDKKSIENLLIQNTRQMGLEREINLKALSRDLIGLSHADIERIAIDATKTTILAGRNLIDASTLKACAENQKRRVGLTNRMVSTSEKDASNMPISTDAQSCVAEEEAKYHAK